MSSGFEGLIKAIYRKYQAGFLKPLVKHPTEEALACLIDGSLPGKEARQIRKHLITCKFCADAFVLQARLAPPEDVVIPVGLIEKIKKLIRLSHKQTKPFLILLKCKENILELIKTNGKVLFGNELVPAPLLRSRDLKDFKDEVIVSKDFGNTRVEVKLEHEAASIFSLFIFAKDCNTARIIKDLRITLLKDNLELESYFTDSGKVIFEHLLLGKYAVEITQSENKVASIFLEIKA